MPMTVGSGFHEGGATHGLASRTVVLVYCVGSHRPQANASHMIPDVANVTLDLYRLKSLKLRGMR